MKKIEIQINFSEDDVHVFMEHSDSEKWFNERVIQEVMNMGYTRTQAEKAFNVKAEAYEGLISLAEPLVRWGLMKSIRVGIRDGNRQITLALRVPNE